MYLIHKSFVKSILSIIEPSKAFDTIYRSELFNIVVVFVICIWNCLNDYKIY